MKDSVGLIGKGIEIEGTLKVDGTLRIEGKITGNVDSGGGAVSIGPSGYVVANIDADICIVEGVLEGDLNALTRVEISPTGRIKGNVRTQNLVIAEGAIFDGKLEMDQHNNKSSLKTHKQRDRSRTAAA